MTKTPATEAVEMRLVGKQYERPPLLRLTFDVVLRNRSIVPQWFFLPDRIALPALPVKVGIDGVEVYALGGKGRVVVARFGGTGRFQAILLPANAEARLRDLPVTFRGELPKTTLLVEVCIAKDFTLGGHTAADWLGINPLSAANSDVSVENRESLFSKDTPGLTEVPVLMVGARKIELQVKTDISEK